MTVRNSGAVALPGVDQTAGPRPADGAPDVLAWHVEAAQRAYGRIRYGSEFRIGSGRVVLNPDLPLPDCNFASSISGTPGSALATVRRLPEIWAEAGLSPVTLVDSPSSLPELSALVEDVGFVAEEESSVVLLERPEGLMDREPGILTRPVRDGEEAAVAALLAEVGDHSGHVERALRRLIGHRLDDPRVVAFAASQRDALAGVAFGFAPAGGLALVTAVAVLPAYRRRGFGRALVSAVGNACRTRGAQPVAAIVDASYRTERWWVDLGFDTAYETVTYSCPA